MVSDAFLFLATKAKESIKTAFAGTLPTQKISKDLNDVFDILNGRRPAESIMRISWVPKKKVSIIFIAAFIIKYSLTFKNLNNIVDTSTVPPKTRRY